MRAVASQSLRRELEQLAPWALATVLGWVVMVGVRQSNARLESHAPAWQRSYLELSQAEQRRYRQIREGVLEAENARSLTRQWPEPKALAAQGVPPFEAPDLVWSMRQHGVYVNYLGVPRSGGGLRWLVLFIEPEASAFDSKMPAAPVDEEHHTLPDGMALHVTVWSQPHEGTLPPEVLAFPVAEGWVQRVGR